MIKPEQLAIGRRVVLTCDMDRLAAQYRPVKGDQGRLEVATLAGDVWGVVFDADLEALCRIMGDVDGRFVCLLDVCDVVDGDGESDDVAEAQMMEIVHQAYAAIESDDESDDADYFYDDELSEDEKELFDCEMTLQDIELEINMLCGESWEMYQGRIAWLETRADEIKARRTVLIEEIREESESGDDSPAVVDDMTRTLPDGTVLHPVTVKWLHDNPNEWVSDANPKTWNELPAAYLEIDGELFPVFLTVWYRSEYTPPYLVWLHGVHRVWRQGEDVAWIERLGVDVSEPMSLEEVAGDLLQQPVGNVEPVELVVISDAYTLSRKGWAMAAEFTPSRQIILTDKARALLAAESGAVA